MSDTRIKTKPCPVCGMGHVPEDPAISQAELQRELDERLRRPRPEFAEMIARREAEKTRQGG